MNLDELVPGLESFMNDTTVETKVEVSDGDAAADAEVTAGEEEELSDASEEVEETEEQTEMIFAHFDRVETMIQHVERYGADRTFFSLMNSDGYLTAMLQNRGVILPSLESIDATATPYSELSVACLEGLKDVFGKIKDFAKRVCDKIVVNMKRLSEAIKQRVKSLESNIARLRQAAQSKTDEPGRLANSNAKIYSLAQLNDINKQLFMGVGDLRSALAEVKSMIPALKNGELDQAKMDALVSRTEELKQHAKQLKGLRKAIKGERVALTAVPISDALKMLGQAESIVKRTNDNSTTIAQLIIAADALGRTAAVDAPKGSQVKVMIRALNKMASAMASVQKQNMRVATLFVRNAGQRIGTATKLQPAAPESAE